MRKISATIARRRLDSILDGVVKQGKPVVITKSNRPMVVLRPIESEDRLKT